MVAISIAFALAGLAASLYGLRCLRQARLTLKQVTAALSETRQEAAYLEHQREQLEDDLARVRQKRHTHATEICLEDGLAVASDIETEIRMALPHMAYLIDLVRYIQERVPTQQAILAAGRPGPHAYRSPLTDTRPARPGVGIKLW